MSAPDGVSTTGGQNSTFGHSSEANPRGFNAETTPTTGGPQALSHGCAPDAERDEVQLARLERFIGGRPHSTVTTNGRGWLEVGLVLPEWRTTGPLPALWTMWRMLWHVWLGIWIGIESRTWKDPMEPKP